METQKLAWRSIGIPLVLFKTVQRLIVETGDPSVAERLGEETFIPQDIMSPPCLVPKYVRVAVRQRINRDEAKLLKDEF